MLQIKLNRPGYFPDRSDLLLFGFRANEPLALPVAAAIPDIVDEMTPTVQRRVEAMAPTMGKVAEEITRGVKEGLKEE